MRDTGHAFLQIRWRGLAVWSVSFLAMTSPLLGVDGVIEINQARALAGGVTPGDSPGFPVTVDQPGSYRLTGNISVPNENTTAISITVEGVTLDLNGFAIVGPATEAGPNGTGVGVQSIAGAVVVNGTVRGMGASGVSLGARSRAENLHLFFNQTGFNGGFDTIVVSVNASRNRQDGFFIGGDCTVTRCVANENLQDGIRVVERCTVVGNTTTDNDRFGIHTSGSNLVLQNTVSRNASYGLSLGGGTGYSQNLVSDNNGGNGNAQVALNGAIQIGTNICGGDTTCP